MFNFKNELYKSYMVEGLERTEYAGIVCYLAKEKGRINRGFETVHIDTASLADALGITLDRLEEIIWFNHTLKSSTGVIIQIGSNNDVLAKVLHQDALKELFMVLPLYTKLDNIADVFRDAKHLIQHTERGGA